MNFREMGARRYRRRAGFLLRGDLWVALWLSDFWRLTVVERLVESVGLRGCGVVVGGRFESYADVYFDSAVPQVWCINAA